MSKWMYKWVWFDKWVRNIHRGLHSFFHSWGRRCSNLQIENFESITDYLGERVTFIILAPMDIAQCSILYVTDYPGWKVDLYKLALIDTVQYIVCYWLLWVKGWPL